MTMKTMAINTTPNLARDCGSLNMSMRFRQESVHPLKSHRHESKEDDLSDPYFRKNDEGTRPHQDDKKHVSFSRRGGAIGGTSRQKTSPAPVPLNVIRLPRRDSDIMAEALGNPRKETTTRSSTKPPAPKQTKVHPPPGELLEDFCRPEESPKHKHSKRRDSADVLGKYMKQREHEYKSKAHHPPKKPTTSSSSSSTTKKHESSKEESSFNRSQNSLNFEEEVDWKNSSVDWGDEEVEDDDSSLQDKYEESLRRESMSRQHGVNPRSRGGNLLAESLMGSIFSAGEMRKSTSVSSFASFHETGPMRGLHMFRRKLEP